MKKYIADLKMYLEENEVPLIDCTEINQIKEIHYADGDHLTRHGSALLTDALAQSLPDAIPDAFPVQQREKNVIANGDFKNGLKGWQIWSSPKTLNIITSINNDNIADSKIKHNYLKISKKNIGTGGLQTFFPVHSGDVYQVSALIRGNNNKCSGTIGVYIANTPTPSIRFSNLSNDWTRKKFTYKCHTDGVVTVYIHLNDNPEQQSFDVTDVQCIRCNSEKSCSLNKNKQDI